MKSFPGALPILAVLFILGSSCKPVTNQPSQFKLWEKVEIKLEAEDSYSNPYMDVEVWVDLKGPDFSKRCYGFWDGENTWRIRVMATRAGEWTWESGSNQPDRGLNNKKDGFIAKEWTEEEKKENPLRRGMIEADEKGHSFRYADSTPMFWLADTWWPCMTQRYPWYDENTERRVGSPEAGFKDYVRFRKEQGYNGCMVIAGFPNWLDEQSGWKGGGWEDEDGNLPFLVEDGKSDLNQLNPAYFRNMDRKVDYLNAHGFIPFIETARRDIGEYWINNFQWPESYARYIRYLCFRYQGNMVINSPIHLDFPDHAVSKEEWNRAANIIVDEYNWPPFGHMASANPPGNTYHTFGHREKARWLSFHGVGNLCRDHYLLTTIPEIFRLENPVPIVVNEPYYDGLKWGNDADLGSDLAAYYSRVALYGSVLSGALAGHVYGAHHIWRGDEQMPEAFLSKAAGQMQYIYEFLFSEGESYSDLVEAKSLLRPFQTENEDANMGWSYCMRSETMDMFFLYFEKGCQKPLLTGAQLNTEYDLHWFDPASGKWTGVERVKSTRRGFIEFPDFPDGGSLSGTDWALKIKAINGTDSAQADVWVVDSQEDWTLSTGSQTDLKIAEGKAVPTAKEATFQSTIKKFPKKRSLSSISLSQSPEWLNWEPIPSIGPSNLGDAPVALQMGDGNYWMFGRYMKTKSQTDGTFHAREASLEGYDIPLKSTPFKNQFDAPGGLKPGKGGYHAWQSIDLINWVHHGPVSETFSRWMTTAEYVDDKVYLYYDFPNDQDPHLYIDEDLSDGEPGRNMGMAFNDPTHGSDCAVIRGLEGFFHLIVEDWSPINASTHAWDSPLAVHARSPDGINNFEILDPPVDERTTPTGTFAEYVHPHWHAEDPEKYPGRKATVDVPQHKVKAGEIRAFAKYEIHEPEQNAFGDWAAISIGGQYYLFCDYDPAGKHGRQNMSVGWFTSEDINKQFTLCGHVGQGHPDPDVMFAEGRFYLLTQMGTDFISTGPWVETVKVRMGVDTKNDGAIDHWSDWQLVTEQYDYMEGYAKQIEKIPAKLDLSGLPEGYAFQFEVKIMDTTENESLPILDRVEIMFEK